MYIRVGQTCGIKMEKSFWYFSQPSSYRLEIKQKLIIQVDII